MSGSNLCSCNDVPGVFDRVGCNTLVVVFSVLVLFIIFKALGRVDWHRHAAAVPAVASQALKVTVAAATAGKLTPAPTPAA